MGKWNGAEGHLDLQLDKALMQMDDRWSSQCGRLLCGEYEGYTEYSENP